jgi:hypothetical protein
LSLLTERGGAASRHPSRRIESKTADSMFRVFRELREGKGRHFGVMDRKSRQRLDCVCLSPALVGGAQLQPQIPGVHAPKKSGGQPRALQTLARARHRLPNTSNRLQPFTTECREEPILSFDAAAAHVTLPP